MCLLSSLFSLQEHLRPRTPDVWKGPWSENLGDAEPAMSNAPAASRAPGHTGSTALRPKRATLTARRVDGGSEPRPALASARMSWQRASQPEHERLLLEPGLDDRGEGVVLAQLEVGGGHDGMLDDIESMKLIEIPKGLDGPRERVLVEALEGRGVAWVAPLQIVEIIEVEHDQRVA